MNETLPVTEAKAVKIPALPDAQTVTKVRHWTDRLFSFRVTRPASLRFRSGEFVMIGLMSEDEKTGREKPLLRAYSIASPSWDDELEFYSIKVPDGPLTSRLQHIEAGDEIILRPKPVGTLVHDALLPGRRIWFFATGTGIAPFASLLRDPQTYADCATTPPPPAKRAPRWAASPTSCARARCSPISASRRWSRAPTAPWSAATSPSTSN